MKMDHPIRLTIFWQNSNKITRRRSWIKTNGCTLYTHSLGPYIKAAVTYKKSDDDVTITSSSVYTGSPYLGNDPSFSGASSVSYDKDKKLIAASCSGTLSFKDGSRKVEVTVQKTGFMIPWSIWIYTRLILVQLVLFCDFLFRSWKKL